MAMRSIISVCAMLARLIHESTGITPKVRRAKLSYALVSARIQNGNARRWGFGTWRLQGHTPHGSWSGGLEAAHQATEQFGFRASCREGNAHPRRGFTDPCGDFDQAHLQGFEFCGGEWLQLGDTATDFQQQPVSASVQHQADLIGQW